MWLIALLMLLALLALAAGIGAWVASALGLPIWLGALLLVAIAGFAAYVSMTEPAV